MADLNRQKVTRLALALAQPAEAAEALRGLIDYDLGYFMRPNSSLDLSQLAQKLPNLPAAFCDRSGPGRSQSWRRRRAERSV